MIYSFALTAGSSPKPLEVGALTRLTLWDGVQDCVVIEMLKEKLALERVKSQELDVYMKHIQILVEMQPNWLLLITCPCDTVLK